MLVEVRKVVHRGVVAQGALALLAAKVPVEALAVTAIGLAVVVAEGVHPGGFRLCIRAFMHYMTRAVAKGNSKKKGDENM